MNDRAELGKALLRNLQWGALAVGVIGVVACIVGALWSSVQLLRSYLMGYIFYCGLSLGCLAILMMNHLTGGAWGVVPRRLIEAGAKTLPLLILLFIPIAIGVPWLYPWAKPESAGGIPLSFYRSSYLNIPFFLVRSAALFAFGTAAAYVLGRWSRPQLCAQPPERLQQWLRTFSAPGLLLSCVLTTFVYIDWVMTLQPQWDSTIFGMLIVCGQALSAFAFVIIMLVSLSAYPPLSTVLSTKVLHDLGNLLQAFVLLWAYLAFSQLLIIWSGNLPREISWYVPRLQTSWRLLGVALIVGHFALPFFLLLFRALKRRRLTLGVLAGWVLALRLCDQFWLVAPEFYPQGLRVHALDVVVPLALGGLWLAFYCWLLRRGPLLEGESR